MTVTVLVFAAYAEALGAPEVSVTVPAGSTIADVLAEVRALPGGTRIPEVPLLARNQRYAALSDPVEPADEIAVIPPVAGG